MIEVGPLQGSEINAWYSHRIMSLIFLVTLGMATQLAVSAADRPRDAFLATSIAHLFHTVFTTDDDRKEAAALAEVNQIYAKHGLPSVADVGDESAYELVVLLASRRLPFAFRSQVLVEVKKAAAGGKIPSDAAVFYAARLRLDHVKKTAAAHTAMNPRLRDQIEDLSKNDQAVRQQEGFNAGELAKVDRQNATPLQAIMDRYGVPTYSMVGPQAADDFIIMIQHQPPSFRERVLAKLKENVSQGQADPESYAKVYDRSQNDMGKKQLYGEQLVCSSGEGMHEAPIEDEAHVNQRRAELGLIRVELYVHLLAELMPQFCPPVHVPN